MTVKKPKIIAHRGLRTELPENTVPALSAGIELGVYGVEFDVDLTKDDIPVVLHQETIHPVGERLLGLAHREAGIAWVSDYSWEDLSRFDAGAWHSAECRGVKVPSLTEVLDLSWGSEVTAFLELKNPYFFQQQSPQVVPYAHRIVERTAPALEQFAKGHKMKILSFCPTVLERVRVVLPEVERIYAIDFRSKGRSAQTTEMIARFGASTVLLPDSLVLSDPTWVVEAHQHGLLCNTYEWTPDALEETKVIWTAATMQPRWNRLIELGVDVITTDFARDLMERLTSCAAPLPTPVQRA